MLSKTENSLSRIERFLQGAAEELQELPIDKQTVEYHKVVSRLRYSMKKFNKSWLEFVSLTGKPECYKHDKEDLVNPNRYKGKDGKDLLQVFEESLLTDEEYKGFLKGNVYKYVKRYEFKNGKEDLEKATVYLKKLHDFEVQHEKEKQIH